MAEGNGLIFACELDGHGGGREVGWDAIPATPPTAGFLWVHLDYEAPNVGRWLAESSAIDPLICEALTAEDPRPRSLAHRDGLLLILRGVNEHPGSDPEDMVSIRMWIEANRAITLRRRRVMAVQDLQETIAKGSGPRDAGDFLVDLADHLIERLAVVLADLDERIDAIEESMLVAEARELRPKLSDVRRQCIGLRRYLAPQRDVLSRLQTERVGWFDEIHRNRLREIGDRTTRYVEDLDADRERSAVTHEELDNRLSEQLNRRMYALSVIAGIFLPLSFLTGLLGINVGGIPGSDTPTAFAIVCGLMTGIAAFQIWLFRRLRWM
ncbi:MAG: zinc transporter ZntB [Myxococcales bacterium]|nr:zinc transporter ZntB [Myxococcales bacterium]